MRWWVFATLWACSGPPEPTCDEVTEGCGVVDLDRDGCPDHLDANPAYTSRDHDGDGVARDCDLCIGTDALGDLDGDGRCADRDEDEDGDGCPDASDARISLDLVDVDLDGISDDCDLCEGFDATGDVDSDGICDSHDHDNNDNGCVDSLESTDAMALLDVDRDGEPELCQDQDEDGCPDVLDVAPARRSADVDDDGLGNDCDTNDDGDACLDVYDHRPQVEGGCIDCFVWQDADVDYLCDQDDPDDDNDGCRDALDPDPSTPNPDLDGDGRADLCDPDDDGDQCEDSVDPDPEVPETEDADGDGIPDACDHDVLRIDYSPDILLTVLSTPSGDRVVGTGVSGLRSLQLDGRGAATSQALPLTRQVRPAPGCDLDGDGWDEVFTGARFRDQRSGAVLASLPGVSADAQVLCADVDADGDVDVLVQEFGSLALYDHQGRPVQTFPTQLGLEHMSVAQLDADPALEIVMRNRVIRDGRTWTVQGQLDSRYTDMWPVDVDGDGVDGFLAYIRGTGWELVDSGRLRWSTEEDGIAIAGDFDGDGRAEVVMSRTTPPEPPTVDIFDGPTGDRRARVRHEPCDLWLPVDANGDGVRQLWCEGAGGTSVLHPVTGEVLPHESHLPAQDSPLVVDLDGDGLDEILWRAAVDDELSDRAVLRDIDGAWLGQIHFEPGVVVEPWDADDDGDLELLVGFDVWDWSPANGLQALYSLAPRSVSADLVVGRQDVNGDGLPEVLYATRRARGLWDVGWVHPQTGQTGQLNTAILAPRFFDIDGDGALEWFTEAGVVYDVSDLPRPFSSSFADRQTGMWVRMGSDLRWQDGGVVHGMAPYPETMADNAAWASRGLFWYRYATDGLDALVGVGPNTIERIGEVARGPMEASEDHVWIGGRNGLFRYRRLSP